MLVFTITNKVTNEVWVGTCKDSSEERFQQLCEAMNLGIKAQIYKDLRDFGINKFVVEDYAFADDREELKELFSEAMEFHNGKSLTGVKTSLPKPPPAPAKRASRPAAKKSAASASAKSASSSASTNVAKAPVKEKISSGRVSSSKEKIIREKIALEKAKLEAEKSKQIIEQADEMKAILARIDARSSGMKRR